MIVYTHILGQRTRSGLYDEGEGVGLRLLRRKNRVSEPTTSTPVTTTQRWHVRVLSRVERTNRAMPQTVG